MVMVGLMAEWCSIRAFQRSELSGRSGMPCFPGLTGRPVTGCFLRRALVRDSSPIGEPVSHYVAREGLVDVFVPSILVRLVTLEPFNYLLAESEIDSLVEGLLHGPWLGCGPVQEPVRDVERYGSSSTRALGFRNANSDSRGLMQQFRRLILSFRGSHVRCNLPVSQFRPVAGLWGKPDVLG